MNEEARSICTEPDCGGAMIDVPAGESGPGHIKRRCDKCGREESRSTDNSEFTEGSALPGSAEKYPFTK